MKENTVKHETGHFYGYNQQELFMQSWQPPTVKRALVVLIHGLGEHSGRYRNVVDYLVPQGYAIYSFDHRGHGRSPGRHYAHVDSWAEYRGDVQAFLQLAHSREPELPLFLFGHSMGGLITLNYVLHHPEGIQGVIASAPAVAQQVVPAPLRLASLLLSWLRPETQFDNGLPLEGLSRDKVVITAYRQDPLVHEKVSARWFTEFRLAIDWTQVHAGEWKLPLLLLHGDADTLVDISGSKRFFEQVTFPDRQFIIYPGGYHESHNDLHKEQMLADVARWLEDHLP